MIGTIPLAASFLNPAAVPKRRRSLYANIFDRLGQGGDQNLTDDQKEGLTRQGLLNIGIGMLQTKGQGFGGALGAGLQSGLLSVNQGVEDIGNQRYKDEILARTRQGMERNTAIEKAQQGLLNPDGSLNEEQWAEYANYAPQEAVELREKLAPKGRKNPGQPVYLTTPDGKAEDPYFWDEATGTLVPADTFLGGQQAPQIGGDGFLAGATVDAPAAGGFNEVIGGLLGREGGYVADDAGAGPSNFGINSRANPDVDVANLTPQQAMELYKVRYWDPIGGDSLPPQIREAAFDAAVNQGPERAKQWLASANNDPREFARLRQQHYDSLVQRDPAKYGQYADGWRRRNQETAGLAGGDVPSPMRSRLGRRAKKGDDTMGSIPAGYRLAADGQSLEPIPGGPADKKNNPVAADLAKGEMGMRKEAQDRIEKDRTVLNMFQNVRNAASNESAAGDLSLIFSFMKMLDPGSVVREQEFANAQNAAGVPDRIRNLYNQAQSGQRLNPTQRQDFINQANALASEAQNRITGVTKEYQGIADQYGWDPVRATGQADFRNVQSRVLSGGEAAASAAGGVDDLLSKYGAK